MKNLFEETFYIDRGKLYLNQKGYNLAIKEFQKAIKINPENKDAHFELGKTYYIQNKYPSAIKEFKDAIKFSQDNIHAHILLGKTYKEEKRYSLATRELERAIKHGYDNEEVHRELAIIYQETEKYEEAIEELKILIKLNPKDGKIYATLGRIYQKKGEYILAIKEFKKTIRKGVDKDVHRDLGIAYFKVGEYEPAIKEFKEAIRRGIKDENLYQDLGIAYFKMEEYELAIGELEKALKLNPENGETHAILGRVYKKKGDYPLAIKEFKEAIRKCLDDDEIHRDLGNVYYQRGEYELATRELKKALEINPENGEAHVTLGRTYEKRNNHALAIKEFKEAIRRGIKDESLYQDLGMAYFKMGKHELAIGELEEALEINPENDKTHATLGKIYKKKEEYTLAIKEFKRAVEIDIDDNEELHGDLGIAYYHNEKYELAIEEFKKALELNPENPRWLTMKCATDRNIKLSRRNNKEKEKYESKMKEIRKAIKKEFETDEIHVESGKQYREIGEYDLSIKEFEKAIQLSSHKNEIFFKNRILNEIEISQRKTVLKSKPRELGITLTNRCNLKCKMCDYWKNPWDISERRVEEIVEYFPYLQTIFWSSGAGEVFLSKYFEEMFKKTYAYPDLKQTINTNGLLIDEKWAKELARNNVMLNYSIDGVTKKTYEHIRRGGKFEDLIRSINIVNKYKERHNRDISLPGYKMITRMNFVVMKSNYHEMEKVIDFAKEYKFDGLTFLSMGGGYEDIFFPQDLEALNYIEKFRPKLLKKADEYKIILENWLPKNEIFNTSEVKIHKKERKTKTNYSSTSFSSGHLLCYVPWQSLSIGPEREIVKPQCTCPHVVGNIRKSSLEEIWNNKEMQLYRQKLLNNCLDWCDYKCISNIMPQEILKLP